MQRSEQTQLAYRQLLAAVAVVSLSTGVGLAIRPWVADADIVMVFLLGVMFVAYQMERLPAITSALLSVAAFDFFFVTPYHTFAVHQLRYVLTFAVMAVVGVAISGLTARVKGQAEAARRREENTAALYEFVQKLALETEPDELLETAARHICELFDADVGVFRVGSPSQAVRLVSRCGNLVERSPDREVLLEAYESGESTEMVNDSEGERDGLCVPIVGVSDKFGIVAVVPSRRNQFSEPEQRHLLEAHVGQIGLFLERLSLSEEARQTQVELETERVRNAILSSVSHDLRTPLGSIMGAASTLVGSADNLSREARTNLGATIYEESRRLDRLLENLLKMTRIEGEDLEVDAEWQIPSEIVGSALSHLEPELNDREVSTALPSSGRVARFDGPLIEQVLVNLLENAANYTPADGAIEVRADLTGDFLRFEVADTGPGVPLEERERIFEKFQQGGAGGDAGSGLGLTICRAIVEAHDGVIEVDDRSDRQNGAVFRFTLPQPEPLPDEPPPIDNLCNSNNPPGQR